MGLFFKKRKQILLMCFNNNDELIQSMKVSELKLKEDYILRVSHDEYHNDEPCVITRSAIAGDLLNSLQKYIASSINETNDFIIKDLPEKFINGIEWNPQVIRFKVVEK